ncbi:hypothetical protein [Georgenia satyanarayanai]|nr:hypothetical protein [Georgenia satyanarayanai]
MARCRGAPSSVAVLSGVVLAGTDVPPWPEGYADYLSTTVLERLLATC